MYSLLHSLYFLPISPAQDVFWPDQQTPITSIPRGPWHRKLKQWLLRKSQAFRLRPSPNLPPNWTSHQIYPTQLTWLVFASASSNSLLVRIPKESFISPPQLPTNLWNQTPASRLWGYKLKYVKRLDLEHECVDWTGETTGRTPNRVCRA